METREELLKQLEELKVKIDRLDAAWLQVGDHYWLIDSYGDVVDSFWEYRDEDIYRKAIDNVFRSKENAELWIEIQNRAIDLCGDWKTDWVDIDREKYFLYWDYVEDCPRYDQNHFMRTQGVFYMPRHAVETLIKEYGVRLKIWVCGED